MSFHPPQIFVFYRAFNGMGCVYALHTHSHASVPGALLSLWHSTDSWAWQKVANWGMKQIAFIFLECNLFREHRWTLHNRNKSATPGKKNDSPESQWSKVREIVFRLFLLSSATFSISPQIIMCPGKNIGEITDWMRQSERTKMVDIKKNRKQQKGNKERKRSVVSGTS